MYTQPKGGSNQDIGILNSQYRSPLSNVAEYDGLISQNFENCSISVPSSAQIKIIRIIILKKLQLQNFFTVTKFFS